MLYPNDANGDVFRRLEAHGFDFGKPHSVEFHAVLPNEEAADRVAETYVADHQAGEKFDNIETKPGRTGGMALTVVKPMHVTYDNVSQFESKFRERVSKQGGHLDGWGVMQE